MLPSPFPTNSRGLSGDQPWPHCQNSIDDVAKIITEALRKQFTDPLVQIQTDEGADAPERTIILSVNTRRIATYTIDIGVQFTPS